MYLHILHGTREIPNSTGELSNAGPGGEGPGRTTAMHGLGKSDETIVAKKSTNHGTRNHERAGGVDRAGRT